MNRKILLLILAVLLVFSGCKQEEPESTEPMITWDSIPQLTYGQMEYEKLSVLPWYSGRTETSTFHKMVETEQGYYMIYNHHYLFYADKTDLSNWLPVCNRPDCKHKEDIGCNARCERWVWMRDGRLYFREAPGDSPHLYQSSKFGYIYLSALPDMTDKRLEYVNEDALTVRSEGASSASALMGNCIVESATTMDEMGNEICNWFVIDDKGYRKIQGPGAVNNTAFSGDSDNFLNLNGELCLCYGALEGLILYRLVDDTFVKMDIDANLLELGGYLSGNAVRYFKENEGYYDYNLSTGNAVLVSAPYRENSLAWILAPNCIIETNMMFASAYTQPPRGESWLALFDGESWREVQLPPELATISDDYLIFTGITSDSVLVQVLNRNKWDELRLYRIPIGEEELRLEYCADITFPDPN